MANVFGDSTPYRNEPYGEDGNKLYIVAAPNGQLIAITKTFKDAKAWDTNVEGNSNLYDIFEIKGKKIY